MKKILFDTDMGADCDDAAALAIVLEEMAAGECELLAVTHCTMCEAAGGVIEAILRHYGHADIPVGTFHPEDALPTRVWHDVFAAETAQRFPNTGHYEDTVRLMRRVLAASDEKVHLVATGPLTSLHRLMESQPDAVSPLDGMELIRQKVERAYCMAGCFSEKRVEWNVSCDVEAMRQVCMHWPTEMVFCPSETGGPVICGQNLELEGFGPVRFCFEAFHRQANSREIGRSSWDPITMFYAIHPETRLWALSEHGFVSVDADGCTIHVPQEMGLHRYLTPNAPICDAEAALNAILDRDLLREHA